MFVNLEKQNKCVDQSRKTNKLEKQTNHVYHLEKQNKDSCTGRLRVPVAQLAVCKTPFVSLQHKISL